MKFLFKALLLIIPAAAIASPLTEMKNRDMWDDIMFPQFSLLSDRFSPSMQIEFPGLNTDDTNTTLGIGIKKPSSDSSEIKRRFEDVYAFIQSNVFKSKFKIGMYAGDFIFSDLTKNEYWISDESEIKGDGAIWIISDYLSFLKSISFNIKFVNYKSNSDSSYARYGTNPLDGDYNNFNNYWSYEINFNTLLKLNQNNFIRIHLEKNDTLCEQGYLHGRHNDSDWFKEFDQYYNKKLNFESGLVSKRSDMISYFINFGINVGKGYSPNLISWDYDPIPTYYYKNNFCNLSIYCEGSFGKSITFGNFSSFFGLKALYLKEYEKYLGDNQISYIDVLKNYKNPVWEKIRVHCAIPILLNWKISHQFSTFISWSPSLIYNNHTIYQGSFGSPLEEKYIDKANELILHEGSIGFVFNNMHKLQLSIIPSLTKNATAIAFETIINF